MLQIMNTIARRAAISLLETLSFTGLSGEQALLATIVSENPSTDPRVRQRARSLLLLDEGATATEVRQTTAISHRSLAELVERFRSGGLCAALLGMHSSAASRAWLSLSPSSAPRVQIQRSSTSARRATQEPVNTAVSPKEFRPASQWVTGKASASARCSSPSDRCGCR